MDIEDFFEHHGVLGMKWGVRRSSGGGSTATASKPHGKPPWQSPPTKKIASAPASSKGRFVRSKKNQKILSEEAVQIHAIRLKAKKHGVQALTNKELETINKRIELQSKYNKAYPKKKNPLIDLALDTILSDHGSKKITEFMGKKQVHPGMIGVVEAAIAVNKMTRQGKK